MPSVNDKNPLADANVKNPLLHEIAAILATAGRKVAVYEHPSVAFIYHGKTVHAISTVTMTEALDWMKLTGNARTEFIQQVLADLARE